MVHLHFCHLVFNILFIGAKGLPENKDLFSVVLLMYFITVQMIGDLRIFWTFPIPHLSYIMIRYEVEVQYKGFFSPLTFQCQ